ncbi:MAG: hypothetical protein SF123_07625 [Chloroflexota bacterium]|nr:hypothetical protein [Chloroflexota bacterium]
MARTRRAVLTKLLPPTPVTEQMRDDVVSLATKKNVSIADIQRSAIALFLSRNDSNAINIDSLPSDLVGKVKECEQP